ncbi:extensin-like [Impatiens glandulifera]|uniref:extensin-like n=1 Tax=Impatiens glandulifera TaxID=253017 RepID=UPI001FB10642|nr:extensin-like [Impatiens glandulifera]
MMLLPNPNRNVLVFLLLALNALLLISSIHGLETRKDDQQQQNPSICQYPCHNPYPPQPSLPEPLPILVPPPPPQSYAPPPPQSYAPPPPCSVQCCQYPPNSPPNSFTNSPPNSFANSPPMPYTYVPSSSSRIALRLASSFLLLWCGILQS